MANEAEMNRAREVVRRALKPMVGLTQIKQKVEAWIVGGVADKGYQSNVALIAPPGTGKTEILQIMLGCAHAVNGKRGLYFKRGEETGTKTSFVEDVLIPHFHDKPAILGIDEYHETKKPVQTTIRSMMQPTVSRRPHTIRAHGDYEVTFDPYKNAVVIATNKVDLLDQAELTRYQVWNFPYYSTPELAEIFSRALKSVDIKFTENTLEDVVLCNRGTARDIVLWSDMVRQQVAIKGKNTLTKQDVKIIIQRMETFPLGLTITEAKTLVLLEKYGELQLQVVAARNLIAPKEQRAHEKYLLMRGLIDVAPVRRITQEGRKWLAAVRKEGFTLPAVR